MSESHNNVNHKAGECNCHAKTPVNPSVVQSLDEMQFERSVYQAAIDNNVSKITSLARGKDFEVNATDSFGYTALHYAARNGSLEAAKYLIVQLGANVNQSTRSLQATALHRAVTANKVEMVNYLLSVGADPNLKDGDGLTPIDRAVKESRDQIIKILNKV